MLCVLDGQVPTGCGQGGVSRVSDRVVPEPERAAGMQGLRQPELRRGQLPRRQLLRRQQRLHVQCVSGGQVQVRHDERGVHELSGGEVQSGDGQV